MNLSIKGLKVDCIPSKQTKAQIVQDNLKNLIQNQLDAEGVEVSELELFRTLAEASRLSMEGVGEPEIVKKMVSGLMERAEGSVNSPF